MVTTIESLVKLYLANLKEEGKSTNTIRNYEINLKTLNRHFGHISPEKLNHTHLELFQDAVKHKVVGDNRKILLNYLKTLRYFLEWCELQQIKIGLTSADVYMKDKKLQSDLYEEQRRYGGPYLSEKELQKLDLYWKKDSAERTLMALRNRAIVYLLGEGGLKPGEVVELKRLAFVEGFVRVNQRKVPLTANAADIIREYLVRRPDFAEDMIVGYSSFDPDKMITHPLSIREIQRIVKKTAYEVGIKGTINPHVLRNSRLIRSLSDEMSAKDIVSCFGLAESNSSYQRFLLQARKLRGIDEDAINTHELALKLRIPLHRALDIMRSSSVGAIKFRKNYYISQKEYRNYCKRLNYQD